MRILNVQVGTPSPQPLSTVALSPNSDNLPTREEGWHRFEAARPRSSSTMGRSFRCLCAIVGCVVSSAASATMGGSHLCSTADGRLSIDFGHGNGELIEKGTEEPIPYTILVKTQLERSESTCHSQTTKGATHDIIDERYVLRIQVSKGDPSEQVLICENYWDASPAGACPSDDDITLKSRLVLVPTYKSEASKAGATRLWLHNGSTMSLEADGTVRRFHYVSPRQQMLDAGASSGDLLFEGVAKGSTYEGTAYFFNQTCGKTPYQVRGPILDSGRKVMLKGLAPRLDDACNVKGNVSDTLVFELVEPQKRSD